MNLDRYYFDDYWMPVFQELDHPKPTRVFEKVETTYIYYIQSSGGGPIKVGKSHDPYSRIYTLQTGNPDELKFVGMICGAHPRLEPLLHQKYSDFHIRGEWFHPEIFDVDISELLTELSIARTPIDETFSQETT